MKNYLILLTLLVGCTSQPGQVRKQANAVPGNIKRAHNLRVMGEDYPRTFYFRLKNCFCILKCNMHFAL